MPRPCALQAREVFIAVAHVAGLAVPDFVTNQLVGAFAAPALELGPIARLLGAAWVVIDRDVARCTDRRESAASATGRLGSGGRFSPRGTCVVVRRARLRQGLGAASSSGTHSAQETPNNQLGQKSHADVEAGSVPGVGRANSSRF